MPVCLFKATVLDLSPPPRPYRVQSYTSLRLQVENVYSKAIYVMLAWYHGDELVDSRNVIIRVGDSIIFTNMSSDTSCRWSITAIVFGTSLEYEEVIAFSVVNNPDADKENKPPSNTHGM